MFTEPMQTKLDHVSATSDFTPEQMGNKSFFLTCLSIAKVDNYLVKTYGVRVAT